MISSSKKSISLVLIISILMAIFIPTMVNASTVGRIGSAKVGSMSISYTAGNSQVYVNKITRQDGTVVRYVYSSNFISTPTTIAKLKSVLASEYSLLIPENYSGDNNVGIKVCSDSSLVESMDDNWKSSEWVGRNIVATGEIKSVINESGDGINQTAISNIQSHTVLFNEIKNDAESGNRAFWEETELAKKEAWDSGEAAKQKEDSTYVPQEYVYSEYVPLDFGDLTASDIENTRALEENQIELPVGTNIDTHYEFDGGKLIRVITVESVNHVASLYSSHTIIDDTETTINEININLEIPEAGTTITLGENDYQSATQSYYPEVTILGNPHCFLWADEAQEYTGTFWYADANGEGLYSGEMIEGGTYYAGVWFWYDEGYDFAEDVEVTVNDGNLECTNATIYGDGSLCVIVPVTIPTVEKYTLTFNSNGNGKVGIVKGTGTPEDYYDNGEEQNIKANSVYTLDAKAEDGWKFVKWTKDGKKYSTSSKIKVTVTADVEYVAEFTTKSSSTSSGGGSSISSYKVTTKIENGTITPANTSVKKNGNQEFTFKANDGYEITDVLVDGKSIGVVESYKIEKVTAKHTIEVKTSKVSALENVDDWAKEEMKKAEEKGLIPETFAKKDATKPISRLDFAAVAVKLYEALTGKEAELPTSNPFTDTNDEYVLKAYNLGITLGVSENEFGNGPITREQMATMIARALTAAGIEIENVIDKFERFTDDNDISDWAKMAVYFMAEKDIIKGVGEKKYAPIGDAKVEEAIAIALRCVEVFAK